MVQVCFESEVCNRCYRSKRKQWTQRGSNWVKREPNNVFRGNNVIKSMSNRFWNGIWLNNRWGSKMKWRMMNNWKWGKGRRCFSGNSTVRSSDTVGIRKRNKIIEIIIKWSRCNIDKAYTTHLSEIAMDEYINMTTQAVEIFHHTGSPMNYRELIAQELMWPMAKLVDTLSILKDFLDCDTIANLVKLSPHKYCRQQEIAHHPQTTSPTKEW